MLKITVVLASDSLVDLVFASTSVCVISDSIILMMSGDYWVFGAAVLTGKHTNVYRWLVLLLEHQLHLLLCGDTGRLLLLLGLVYVDVHGNHHSLGVLTEWLFVVLSRIPVIWAAPQLVNNLFAKGIKLMVDEVVSVLRAVGDVRRLVSCPVEPVRSYDTLLSCCLLLGGSSLPSLLNNHLIPVLFQSWVFCLLLRSSFDLSICAMLLRR